MIPAWGLICWGQGQPYQSQRKILKGQILWQQLLSWSRMGVLLSLYHLVVFLPLWMSPSRNITDAARCQNSFLSWTRYWHSTQHSKSCPLTMQNRIYMKILQNKLSWKFCKMQLHIRLPRAQGDLPILIQVGSQTTAAILAPVLWYQNKMLQYSTLYLILEICNRLMADIITKVAVMRAEDMAQCYLGIALQSLQKSSEKPKSKSFLHT